MPRSNRPRAGGRPVARPVRSGRAGRRGRSGERPDAAPVAPGVRRTEEYRGAVWVVSPVTGSRAAKPYRCPGCDQEIPPAVPHVVVWPFDGPVGLVAGVAERRHWHTPCWSARDRRGPAAGGPR